MVSILRIRIEKALRILFLTIYIYIYTQEKNKEEIIETNPKVYRELS
jgi:hypothetical protein